MFMMGRIGWGWGGWGREKGGGEGGAVLLLA